MNNVSITEREAGIIRQLQFGKNVSRASLSQVWQPLGEKLAAIPTNGREGHRQRTETLQEFIDPMPDDVKCQIMKADVESDPTTLPNDAPLPTISAYEILTKDWPEPEWAVPGILPAGLTILAGRPKVGKRWLALQIAQSVATGGRVFGEVVEQGLVLYLALEDTPTRLKSRMRKQDWQLEHATNAQFVTYRQFAESIGDLREAEGATKLSQHIQWSGCRLVVVDTLGRAIKDKKNDDYDDMTDALAPLQETAQELNSAVVFIDHQRKPNSNIADAIDDILGSTAKSGIADAVLGLYKEKGKAGATLAITGRDLEARNLALDWDALSGCWQATGDADGLTITVRRGEILDALSTLGPSTQDVIARSIRQDRGNTYRRLQDLTGAGHITRIEEGDDVIYALPEPQ